MLSKPKSFLTVKKKRKMRLGSDRLAREEESPTSNLKKILSPLGRDVPKKEKVRGWTATFSPPVKRDRAVGRKRPIDAIPN